VTSVGKPFQQRKRALQYAEEHGLLKLGEGSTRRVFVLTPKLALKVAIDDDGRAQNKKEDAAYYKTHSPIITKVFKNSHDYSWIVSELVRPVKSDQEFYDLTGLERSSNRFTLGLFAQKRELEKNDFLQELTKFCQKMKIADYDIDRIEQYGVTADQRIVLLDFGI
jgi:hypothetical protein